MALPPLAPVSALETRLGLAAGSLSGVDLARAGAALDDVSALVRDAAGKDWVDVDGVTITAPAGAVTVTVQAALRSYRNPEGYAGESVGDYSWQLVQNGDFGVGVYLTPGEKAIVRRAALGTTGPFLGTVRVPSAFDNPTQPDPLSLSWGL